MDEGFNYRLHFPMLSQPLLQCIWLDVKYAGILTRLSVKQLPISLWRGRLPFECQSKLLLPVTFIQVSMKEILGKKSMLEADPSLIP